MRRLFARVATVAVVALALVGCRMVDNTGREYCLDNTGAHHVVDNTGWCDR